MNYSSLKLLNVWCVYVWCICAYTNRWVEGQVWQPPYMHAGNVLGVAHWGYRQDIVAHGCACYTNIQP